MPVTPGFSPICAEDAIHILNCPAWFDGKPCRGDRFPLVTPELSGEPEASEDAGCG